jgi:hypothetical protein
MGDNNMYKKIKIELEVEVDLDTFILNSSTTNNYINSNPDELILIYSSYEYSHSFIRSIINGGIKPNVKKIITSDSVIVKYLIEIKKIFSQLFPNCKTIQINSFSNDFILISHIIENLMIVENIEYKLNDYILIHNSITKYNNFFHSFFTGNLSNIKNVKIINDIDENKTNCCIEKNQIINIISQNMIDKNNNSQFDYIRKFNINKSHINNVYFEYIDNKRNIYFSKYIVNIINKDYGFTEGVSFL